jgi:hypothetical protein
MTKKILLPIPRLNDDKIENKISENNYDNPVKKR